MYQTGICHCSISVEYKQRLQDQNNCPSLISLMVSVNVKHYVYLLTYQNNGCQHFCQNQDPAWNCFTNNSFIKNLSETLHYKMDLIVCTHTCMHVHKHTHIHYSLAWKTNCWQCVQQCFLKNRDHECNIYIKLKLRFLTSANDHTTMWIYFLVTPSVHKQHHKTPYQNSEIHEKRNTNITDINQYLD